MKKQYKKSIAVTLTAFMSLSALSALTISAESAYALGDVDMDGVITGHDSAMVSRYLNVDSELFTEEQLELADFNGDGTVDQTDADLIHENEVYALGEIDADEVYTATTLNGNTYEVINTPSIFSAYAALNCYAVSNVKTLSVVNKGLINISDIETCPLIINELYTDNDIVEVDALLYHLMDADGDGTVTLYDTVALLQAYANNQVGLDAYEEGRYDLTDAPSDIIDFYAETIG